MVRPPMLIVATFTTFAGRGPPPAFRVADPSALRPRRLVTLAVIRFPEPVSKIASNGPCPLMVALSSTPFLAETLTARAASAAGCRADASGAVGAGVCAARGRRATEIVAEAAHVTSSLENLVLKEASRAIFENCQ